MKHFRRLLPALCLLLISAMCAGTSTYAWFSLNNAVDATGMAVTAKATGSLVIGSSQLGTGSEGTTVDFEDPEEGVELNPAVYVNGTGLMTLKSGLKKDISSTTGYFKTTGVKPSGTDLTDQVSAGSEYMDYSVWVGYQGEEVTSCSWSITATGSSSILGALRAFVEYDDDDTTITITDLGGEVSMGSFVPKAAGEGGTKITIWVYYDGDKADNSGIAIVNDQAVSGLGAISLDFDFTGSNS